MTPRLKFLSVGLAISLAYSIYDYIDRNKKEKTVVTTKEPTKRPRTAGASKQRAIDLKKRIEARKAKKDKKRHKKVVLLLTMAFQTLQKNYYHWKVGIESHLYISILIKKKIYMGDIKRRYKW